MEQSGTDWKDRLVESARAGARVVRLTVREPEMSPTFRAQKLLPFVTAANRLGMYVIIAFDFALPEYDNDRFDLIEDWVREQIPIFGAMSGVMFEPIREIKQITPLRRKNVTQRLIDGLRGYRAVNLYIATEPTYLSELDDALATPLSGNNIVYAVHQASEVPTGRQIPIMLLSVGTGATSAVSIALTEDLSSAAAEIWRTSVACS